MVLDYGWQSCTVPRHTGAAVTAHKWAAAKLASWYGLSSFDAGPNLDCIMGYLSFYPGQVATRTLCYAHCVCYS
jgi:hypothetical protein